MFEQPAMKSSLSNTYPLVSIITVNYNQSRITAELLDSLRKVHYPQLEVIVVDNGSPNDSCDWLKEKYPEINLIISKKNLGFAGGNNLGIKHAHGEYIFLLNNDTEVEPDFIEPLLNVFKIYPDAGMVSPKIIFFHSPGKNLIQYAGGSGINPYTARGGSLGYREEDRGQYDYIRETQLCHGAAVMISKKAILNAGLMPECYFLYYEELDWGEEMKRKGFKIYYSGHSTVYHKESVSTGKNTPLKMYYMTRGRLMFIRRNMWGLKKLLSLLFFFFLAFPKNIITLLMKREFKLLNAFVRAVFWHLYHAVPKSYPRLTPARNSKQKTINHLLNPNTVST